MEECGNRKKGSISYNPRNHVDSVFQRAQKANERALQIHLPLKTEMWLQCQNIFDAFPKLKIVTRWTTIFKFGRAVEGETYVQSELRVCGDFGLLFLKNSEIRSQRPKKDFPNCDPLDIHFKIRKSSGKVCHIGRKHPSLTNPGSMPIVGFREITKPN